MDNFDTNSILLKTLCPNNEFLLDNNDKPSVMVYIPKFTMKQVITGGSDKTHPAFIVNGIEREGFYISKYQNTEIDGIGYSLPAATPRNETGFASSIKMCTGKGDGWHLTTIQEWGAIALICKKTGHLPYGNNDYGKDKREDFYKAIPVTSDKDSEKARVLTGTGAMTWSHDNTAAGIWDMNGNLSEWVGGFRVVYGELQVLPNNDGADLSNSQEADSMAWKAIDAKTGQYITPDGTGTTKNSIKADLVDSFNGWSNKWVFTTEIKNQKDEIRRGDFSFIECDETIGSDAKELIVALGLMGDDPLYDYKEQYCYMNNGFKEGFMYRGGYWGSGAFAGIFCWSSSWGRDFLGEGNGFRASYIPLKR